jgi:hypothetical protein
MLPSSRYEIFAPLLSTDVDVEAARFDAMQHRKVSFTVTVATNAVTWTVQRANLVDFSDASVAQAAASVAAAGVGTFTDVDASFRYYRVLIKATVGGSQGTASIAGVLK